MSRLLTTLLLYRNGYMVGKYISLESKIAKNKNAYYDALEKSQTGWGEGKENPVPFIEYLLGTICMMLIRASAAAKKKRYKDYRRKYQNIVVVDEGYSLSIEEQLRDIFGGGSASEFLSPEFRNKK